MAFWGRVRASVRSGEVLVPHWISTVFPYICIAFMAWFSFVATRSDRNVAVVRGMAESLINAQNRVAEEGMISALKDAQSNELLYLMTNDYNFLEKYHRYVSDYRDRMATLYIFIKPEAKPFLLELNNLTTQKLIEMDTAIDTYQHTGLKDATKVVRDSTWMMEKIRLQMILLAAEERKLGRANSSAQ
jgi:CHASE3 domain sensor protein